MASDVSICNQAISWLGGQHITSLNDDSTEARLCKAIYADVRDAVLEARNWTFAIGRYDLPKAQTGPVNGPANAFPIPPDVLRVVEVVGNYEWRVEGDGIVTNEDAVSIKAVVRVTDPNRFSALFVQALAARLAADLAIAMTQSRELQKQHYLIYEAKLDEATANDGMQGTSRRVTSNWLQASRIGSERLPGTRPPGPTV